MSERPILFSDPMVRAILSGAKTQTRRPVRMPHDCATCASRSVPHHGAQCAMGDGPYLRVPACDCPDGAHRSVGHRVRCPFGSPGDRLWVREAFVSEWEHAGPVSYRADLPTFPGCVSSPRWAPSIHMPRWASRLTLRVTDVRVERVQDITEDDARAEGASGEMPWLYGDETYRTAFRILWSTTCRAGSWDSNPWVWVVSFEREVENG